ncbi:MAG: hypothetical protein IT450_10640 [Phycisphaerales bacterium]|nr:hypothetical protein [Phycisphaerales bacterium]
MSRLLRPLGTSPIGTAGGITTGGTGFELRFLAGGVGRRAVRFAGFRAGFFFTTFLPAVTCERAAFRAPDVFAAAPSRFALAFRDFAAGLAAFLSFFFATVLVPSIRRPTASISVTLEAA